MRGEQSLIEQIREALAAPRWPLFLGRKSCPAPPRLVLGTTQDDLLEALRHLPDGRGSLTDSITTTAAPGQVPEAMIPDHPVSFSRTHRRSQLRGVLSHPVDPEADADPFWSTSL